MPPRDASVSMSVPVRTRGSESVRTTSWRRLVEVCLEELGEMEFEMECAVRLSSLRLLVGGHGMALFRDGCGLGMGFVWRLVALDGWVGGSGCQEVLCNICTEYVCRGRDGFGRMRRCMYSTVRHKRPPRIHPMHHMYRIRGESLPVTYPFCRQQPLHPVRSTTACQSA